MNHVLSKIWPFSPAVQGEDAKHGSMSPAMARLASNLHYEIIPLKTIDQAIADLPANSTVSVTCSPVKGIAATQEICEQLIELGHRPVPHFAARKVESKEHAKTLASWLRARGLPEVFVIAGDAPEPAGPYEGALSFLRDLIDADPGVGKIGITGYPDGHSLINQAVIEEQLHAKNTLLRDAGLEGWISTQMCFDEDAIRTWLQRIRQDGIDLPVRLGVPGVVDRARLMTMGTRLGIGASMRYLAKNRSTVMKLMAPGGYDPTDLVASFSREADRFGIEALHGFTFNAVAETRAWQEAVLRTAGTSTVSG